MIKVDSYVTVGRGIKKAQYLGEDKDGNSLVRYPCGFIYKTTKDKLKLWVDKTPEFKIGDEVCRKNNKVNIQGKVVAISEKRGYIIFETKDGRVFSYNPISLEKVEERYGFLSSLYPKLFSDYCVKLDPTKKYVIGSTWITEEGCPVRLEAIRNKKGVLTAYYREAKTFKAREFIYK